MKGKILGHGTISGDDGARYSYDIADLKNLGSRNPMRLDGAEVDFEIQDGKAANIFITKGGGASVSDLTAGMGMDAADPGVRKVKLFAIIALACGCFAWIPIIGILFLIAFVVCNIIAYLGVRNISQSPTLIKNFIISLVLELGAGLVAAIGTAGAWLGILGIGSSSSVGLIGTSVIFVVAAVLISLAGFIFYLSFMRELAFLTEQKMFLWAYYLTLLGVLTSFVYIGLLFIIAAFVMEIIAWLKVQNIRQAPQPGEVLPWF